MPMPLGGAEHRCVRSIGSHPDRKRVLTTITALPMRLGSDATLVGRQLGAASMRMGQTTSWSRWPHHVTLSSVAEENVLHVRARSLQRPPLYVSSHATSPPLSAADKNIALTTCAQLKHDFSGLLFPRFHTHTHTRAQTREPTSLSCARAQENVRTCAHMHAHRRKHRRKESMHEKSLDF